jgi:AAA domain, putative AbiEii toxin, Type IV TA system/AAA domain
MKGDILSQSDCLQRESRYFQGNFSREGLTHGESNYDVQPFLIGVYNFRRGIFLILQGFDDVFAPIMTLPPLAFWLVFYWLRSILAQRSRASPLQMPQQAENIVICVLFLFTLVTQVSTVYLLWSSRFTTSLYIILFTPLGLSLFFYLGRSLLAPDRPDGGISVSPGLPSSSVTFYQDDRYIPSGPIVIDQVEIENFKNFENLKIDLAKKSSLAGNWTCLAGINGAGKTSILQAICLLLLGEKLATELGGERLKRMLRQDGSSARRAKLTAKCRIGERPYTLVLPLSEDGVDEMPLRQDPDYWLMRTIWSSLQGQMVVSYGATRNISDRKETRNSDLSRAVQRQMTLFDPLTQIASVDVLLLGGKGVNSTILETLEALLRIVLGERELGLVKRDAENRLRFNRHGAMLGAIDLPDGYRSTVAWLADLCAAWHETAAPDEKRSVKPEEITGIVLVDEIDLHLHFRLQREIIPRLRKALPKVQFIVTTHSPMILACFDRNELIVLDEDSSDGQRKLDRQLFGLTMDEIFEYLIGTEPHSPVITDILEKDKPRATELLYQGANKSEAEAREELAWRRQLLQRLQADRNEPSKDEP